jgi:hypothetical protein
MVTLNPTLKLELLGTKVTNYLNESSFALEDKLELSFDIQGTLVGTPVASADYTIPLTTVRHTKMIVIHATGDINLKFTTVLGDFVIPSTGDFVLNTAQAFITSLTSFKINTLVYASPVSVFVSIYGKVPTV